MSSLTSPGWPSRLAVRLAGVIETARHRQRRRRRWILLATLLIAAAAIGWRASAGFGGDHPAGGSTKTDSRSAAITPDSNVSQAVLDALIPVSGAALDSGTAAFNNFTAATRAKVIDACLASRGLPAAPEPLQSALVGDNLMPDITALRARGQFEVLYPAPRDPTAGMSPAEHASYNTVLSRCTRRSPPVNIYRGRSGSITSRWESIVSKIATTSPVVRAANRQGAACSRSTDFPSTDYMNAVDVIVSADQPNYMGNQRAQADDINRRGVAMYLKCFSPAIKAVQRQALAQRQTFIAQNAPALRAVQTDVAMQVSRVEARFSVRFG